MKPQRIFLAAFSAVAVLAFSSCDKSKDEVAVKPAVSAEVISQIKQLGFTSQGVVAVQGGYVVEGDIFLTPKNLANPGPARLLRVGAAEQYRTTNLVEVGTGRTVTVAVSSTLPLEYVTAADEAIARYNAKGLRLSLSRVSADAEADITLDQAPQGSSYLASAGFPTQGNPYNSVLINSDAIGTNNPETYIATILAHEIGHCVGFRHTDYMDRSYSCGGAVANEGASTVGAILIPGTPPAADPDSWMLACIGTGVDRPFNPNDVTALEYLYK